MSKGSIVFTVLLALIGGFAVGHLVGRGSGEDELADLELEDEADEVERLRVPVTDKQPQKGPDDALVTIVEISDFECPFCARVLPTLKQVHEEYGDKVRVVWRNNPLPMHRDARPAATVAMEAHKQGGDDKFWQMHDLLFANQRQLDRDSLLKYAKQIGLDTSKVVAALDNNSYDASINADQALANKLQARGTPGFFINGRQLKGAQPFEKFKEVIDEEVAYAEELMKKGVSRKNIYTAVMKNAQDAPSPPAQPARAQAPQPDPAAVYKVPVADSPQKGPDDALITIIEFSDFECPFCSRVNPTMEQIIEKYGDKVRIVWKNNPLPFHQNATPAAQAALEAHAQGGAKKFWQMHDLLFENQKALTRSDLEGYAQKIGLNMTKFKAALDENEHKASIEQDQALARKLGASGTPSFFINGRSLRGAQPLPAFVAVIDEELEKAEAKVKSGTPAKDVYEETIESGAESPQTKDSAGLLEQHPLRHPSQESGLSRQAA